MHADFVHSTTFGSGFILVARDKYSAVEIGSYFKNYVNSNNIVTFPVIMSMMVSARTQ
jgi:hypothetical protein